jgi:integrase/recombinase XerD
MNDIVIKSKINLIPSAGSVFSGNIVLDPIDQYKLRLGSKASNRTVDTRLRECARIWGCANRSEIIWEKLTKAHVLGLVKTLEHEGKKISTIKNTLSCLKGVIKEAYDLDLIVSENFHKIISVRPPRGSNEDTGRSLDLSEISVLFGNLKKLDTVAGARDNAIINLLITTGLRRTEITKIRLEDYNVQQSKILIKGKGNKERIVGLNSMSIEAINIWLTDYRGRDEGFVFNRIRKCGGINFGKNISDQAIYNIVKMRCGECGIENISTHDLRRTFATQMIKSGTDIIHVMKMMGHSNMDTTKRYDKSGDNEAINLMKNTNFV